MIYLLLGEDSFSKDRKIEDIRAKTIKSPEALQFDYEVLHASKLSPVEFKKSLLALPALSEKRLILIRESQKLSDHNKKLILEFIDSGARHVDLILESLEDDPRDAFLKKLSGQVKVFETRPTVKHNAFNMTDAMMARDPLKALQILSDLFSQGQHPLQVMGAVVWFWGRLKDRLPAENFKKGLFELQQADLNIKRSRLDPEYALEVLVVKLTNLVAY